jgi:hypothetical protein
MTTRKPKPTAAEEHRARTKAEWARRDSAMLAGMTSQELGETGRAGTMEGAFDDLGDRAAEIVENFADARACNNDLIMDIAQGTPLSLSAVAKRARHIREAKQRMALIKQEVFVGTMLTRTYKPLLPAGAAAFFTKTYADFSTALEGMRRDLAAAFAAWGGAERELTLEEMLA